MSEWIKCSDRIPELAADDTEASDFVLVYQTYFGSRFAQALHGRVDVVWYDEQGEIVDGEVTHWMPLPSPPEDSQ